jgi:hypothetical protein
MDVPLVVETAAGSRYPAFDGPSRSGWLHVFSSNPGNWRLRAGTAHDA